MQLPIIILLYLLSVWLCKLTHYDIEPVIYGVTCECDNFNCDIVNGTICSGKCEYNYDSL